MRIINIGLCGYGTVGQGVAKFLKEHESLFKDKYNVRFIIHSVCDLSMRGKNTKIIQNSVKTKNIDDLINNPDIDVIVELIGGMKPAKTIVSNALKNGKHVITANKELIANCGKELFTLAQKTNKQLYFESSVGAGIPIIKTITEGIVGNKFDSVYGIVNGTCNFILDEMTSKNLSFDDALKDAQQKGYAESDPTLDINGADSAHKLAILTYLAFGKYIKVKDIYTEGISHISHDDIEYAESLNLTIKLLAIAKKVDGKIEARVHPTLISKDHPLASIHSIFNAIYLNTNPLGDILLSGEGAGQMAAASGVISDLINLASKDNSKPILSNINTESAKLKVGTIDQIKTKFYLRFMATDKAGVLSKIAGVLGKHDIGINSVTQKAHNKAAKVPVIMLTDYTTEKKLRTALNSIHKSAIVKAKPIAIRLENLS